MDAGTVVNAARIVYMPKVPFTPLTAWPEANLAYCGSTIT